MGKVNQSSKRQLERLRKEIFVGSKQADRGSFVEGKVVFAEIRSRSIRRKLTRSQASE
ncbi:MAG TPA: hypothetical protein VKX49_02895 [Bryobacteraceae bacterium]|nr:hypothetical protein [Bryobacteraceae bacterium]